ncbi:TetR/AcrR family transcriptional regulator [Sphingomonas sp. MMS24-J13]|uniref:TetR/AcrR family transcriptional regulator n=1 Tax=Sphingomonas sp. MMS24-J13 TaxID=3238686 RepID=UPI00384F4C36
MNDIAPSPSAAGQRGPADHSIREQIVAAADAHFSHYGYGKTTVSDLAKVIGFSKAYIYKFFDSKQAIGEAICTRCLTSITDTVEREIAGAKTATEKFRILCRTVSNLSRELFFNDRKIYDIAVYSCEERWPSSEHYIERLGDMLERIIVEGRESGEFERKTPLDETRRAILGVMKPFINPLMLQYNLDELPDGVTEMTSLVLRSLAP